MLIAMHSRAPPDDLIGLLLACHENIRCFARLAHTVATRADADDDEVREALSRVARYFREGLPLHVEDEERSLWPRLRALDGELDDALESMHHQHVDHAPLLAGLLVATHGAQRTPRDADARRVLASASASLMDAMEEHLRLEEEVIFPAAQRVLAADEHVAVLGELRRRRTPAMGP